MAVEDGAVLDLLLGLAHERLQGTILKKEVEELLLLFEKLRKARTTEIVQGVVHNRWFYHMPDGEEQQARDQAMKAVDWERPQTSAYQWVCGDHNVRLLAHDVLRKRARRSRHGGWLAEGAAGISADTPQTSTLRLE
jgi:salicylate hydroxylase